MSKPIVEVDVVIHLRPIAIRVQIDTREGGGEWDAERVKTAANEIAHDRYRHSEETPEIRYIETTIR